MDLDTAAVHIFEYDRRFGQAYPDSFVYYDYNEPQRVPDGLRGSMDFVLMDPPYLVRLTRGRPNGVEIRRKKCVRWCTIWNSRDARSISGLEFV